MDHAPPTPPRFTEIQIRPVNRADLPGLEWEGEYIHYRRLFQDVYRRTRLGRAQMWVAVLSPDLLVGQLFVQFSSVRTELADGRTRAYMHAFRVRPEYRNAGLGARLLITAEQDLLARGFRIVTLNVAQDNPDALRFYRRHDYAITAPEPGRWSYIDHLGRQHEVHEPSWRLEKNLLRSPTEPNAARH